jgi:hypothetical protein
MAVVNMLVGHPDDPHRRWPELIGPRDVRLADAALSCSLIPLVVSAALALAGLMAGEPRLLVLVVMAVPLTLLGWLGRRHPASVGAFLVVAGIAVAVAYPLLNAGLAGGIVLAVETALLLPAVATGLLLLRLAHHPRTTG